MNESVNESNTPAALRHSAARTAFTLRAAIINEKERVADKDDAVAWNALEIFGDLAKQITDALDQANSKDLKRSRKRN